VILVIAFYDSLITATEWVFYEEYNIRTQLRDNISDVHQKVEIVVMNTTVLI